MNNHRASEFTERVTFRRVTETQDEYGTLVESWADLAIDVPAKVTSGSGGEGDRGQQIEVTASYMIVVRSSTRYTLNERDVAVWNGKTLNIRFIPDLGARARYVEIDTEHIVP